MEATEKKKQLYEMLAYGGFFNRTTWAAILFAQDAWDWEYDHSTLELAVNLKYKKCFVPDDSPVLGGFNIVDGFQDEDGDEVRLIVFHLKRDIDISKYEKF